MDKIIEKLEVFLEFGGIKRQVALLIISAISLIISIFTPNMLPFEAAWIAMILCGLPIVLWAIIALVTEFDIKAGLLVTVALIASIYIGEIFAAAEVAFIMQLGELLENLTVAKARSGIERLVKLTPQTARLIKNGEEKIIPAEQVSFGDMLRVLPGETIAVDGVIVSGESSVNQAVLTGESLLVDKKCCDEVFGGTVNQFGVFEMKAEKVGENTAIARMIRLVQSADAGKARLARFADKCAAWIVVAALCAALITGIVTGEIIRAVTVLVVFCPCSLVLATPTAIVAAIGNAAKYGILVREGDALERLSKVEKVCFDKTGTLTYGTPEVVAVESVSGVSAEEVYKLTASAEQFSEHPLGKAVVKCYKDAHEQIDSAENFKMTAGRGVSVDVNSKSVICGNADFMSENNVAISDDMSDKANIYISKGCSVIYTAIDKILSGFVALSDTIREESADVISDIKAIGLQPVLLTGDNKNAAGTIANRIGIEEIKAGCLPEDKLNYIDELQSDSQSVCMIGDGINDAPSMKKSDVGIAMGGIGSDITVEAADIVLAEDEIKHLPHLINLSKRMMKVISLNIAFSLGLNFLSIAFAITGVLNPVAGALVHNAGSIVVIFNSILLLKYKKRK